MKYRIFNTITQKYEEDYYVVMQDGKVGRPFDEWVGIEPEENQDKYRIELIDER